MSAGVSNGKTYVETAIGSEKEYDAKGAEVNKVTAIHILVLQSKFIADSSKSRLSCLCDRLHAIVSASLR